MQKSSLTDVPCGLQVSACGELARLGLVAGTSEPAAATALYDWDLATAALAASHAVKRQLAATLAQGRPSQQAPPQPKGELPLHINAQTGRLMLCLPHIFVIVPTGVQDKYCKMLNY